MRDKHLYDRPLHSRPIIQIPIRFVFIRHDCSMPGVAPVGIEEYGPLNKGGCLPFSPPLLWTCVCVLDWFHQLIHSITCSLIGYIVRPPFVLVYNKPLAIVEGGRILDPS
ncbi:hypothetical protein XELAEV_18029199mg [Xenopus laevis]|uniref:Uncharacterized protein n=1 Tax=Xenopus laevis TaxID=8355 RepID=A0A974CT00_XENLA|nr:hypothetical protein XELAEV_18029199mg [Xenopus laevis]